MELESKTSTTVRLSTLVRTLNLNFDSSNLRIFSQRSAAGGASAGVTFMQAV